MFAVLILNNYYSFSFRNIYLILKLGLQFQLSILLILAGF